MKKILIFNKKIEETTREVVTLMKVLRSKKIRTFILKKHQKGIIPLF